eukprot:CAMPEP_0171122408 /NCGR_PEP_ID=MMETSP0766_2-20121228/104936_1 /TAXON_ID=439317 /ORGANISM="Gambierdiscus australes, Strain CAWD 149" /LENGTH=354 /DNA_ID=CAMNT_0011585247 /DNA_START=69 /DNA_END=1133 /DNA_ORIENTATION=-
MSFPLPPSRKQRDTDYEVGELYGRGTYTSVYQATEIASGKSYAMKIVDRYRCERLKKTKDLYMEKHCLRRTNHPNIVKMCNWFSDTSYVYVVMEECKGGELWDLVKTVGCPEGLGRHYLAQVINGMEYLRQARIVHRDLKAENIMLSGTGVVKLIDFGTAKDLENPHIEGAGNASRHKVFKDYVGTPQFMPKEVIENKCTDFRSDIWSFGCTMFQVLVGCPPFHGASEYLIFQRILGMDLQMPPGVPSQARDLISRMVVQDPNARLGANSLEEVRAHPYFKGVTFGDTHLQPKPLPTLTELCLQKVGRNLKEMRHDIEAWEGRAALKPEVREVLERMETSQKWQDAVLPPEEEW